ncbi:MAG: T9SS type A sorting domain-containing protein [Bacteroidia bacterium]|nr:T9SS type A sorting domain-containing protein [Bacteroidia bacterium]
MKRVNTLFSFILFAGSLVAQQSKQVSVPAFYMDESEISSNEYKEYVSDHDTSHRSIHQIESEKYAVYQLETDQQWDSLRAFNGETKVRRMKSNRACTLQKRVYGWHPYWNNGLQANYDWAGLTDLCYFSYEVNPANGNAVTTHNWSTATVVTDAQANGVNVTLCATLFGASNLTTFLGNTTAQQTLITNLINAVQSRNAKGVNIDFEGMGASHKVPFTTFMNNLCTQMHAAIPNSEVSIALYAVDWSGSFDMAALNNYVDLFIIMGYDYYWSGSSNAGPESPLYNFETSYNYTLTKSITYYLKQGASKNKLLLGLPYYGREWSTASASTIPSATTGSTNTVTYKAFKQNANGYYNNRQWDQNSFSAWFPSTRTGTPWQCFIDDVYSMGKRFDMVNQRGIGGIGIWALGNDDGYNDMWNLIAEKFTDCAVVPCTDTIYDMGGPNRNYYDSENYTFTIAPANANSVTLNFSSFNTELNYDTLWIYNGNSTAAPLIGFYHGTNSPGTVSSTGGSMTIRFKSDNATVSSGWQAIWNCTIDNTAPTTLVATPSTWQTTNFTATFTDTDNSGGTGIEKSFYQVLDYDGTEWRANNTRGFFSDNFDAAIHPDWTQQTGVWSISSGYLKQSDQTNTNTNIWAPLTQNLSNRYLYNWQGKIDGTGTNRRAGLHFFCDNATQTNRGNSYFVWFRVDQSACEFYEVTNNTFTLMNSVPMTIVPNQWYDYKVLYDRISGKMDVYQNNVFIGSWTDPTPLANGNAISFRSGDCDNMINDLKVYRSRAASVTVTVGTAATNDVRHENASPAQASCRVKSITKDAAGNLSSIASKDVNIDWTAPSTPLVVDGSSADIDTSYSLTSLSGNWSVCVDTNSNVVKYWYSIGTTAGATDVLNWTNNNLNTSITQNGLSLSSNQLYYINVRSENGAGILSSISSSDGQLVLTPTSVAEINESLNILLYPNPASESATLQYSNPNGEAVDIRLMDALGKEIRLISQENQAKGNQTFIIHKNQLNLASGMYVVSVRIGNSTSFVKLMME